MSNFSLALIVALRYDPRFPLCWYWWFLFHRRRKTKDESAGNVGSFDDEIQILLTGSSKLKDDIPPHTPLRNKLLIQRPCNALTCSMNTTTFKTGERAIP